MNWIDLSHGEKLMILEKLKIDTNLDVFSIEKDWWVTMVLRALFASEFAEHFSFKGGTSLSKCFRLINRFSEDVDIAVNREFLGFSGELSKTQVSDRLRRASCDFSRNRLPAELEKQLIALGIPKSEFEVKVNITSVTTTDPEIIEIEYSSVFNEENYVRNKVLVEVSGRSMNEPTESVEVSSIIGELLPNAPYTDKPFTLTAVSPKRTFLEKACLLHEEFAQNTRAVRSDRMSRHIYDLERMMSCGIAEEALADTELYRAVIEHRRKFVGLKDFDYEQLLPQNISFVPPADFLDSWASDYRTMTMSMIYGDTLSFEDLIARIKELNNRFRKAKL